MLRPAASWGRIMLQSQLKLTPIAPESPDGTIPCVKPFLLPGESPPKVRSSAESSR